MDTRQRQRTSDADVVMTQRRHQTSPSPSKPNRKLVTSTDHNDNTVTSSQRHQTLTSDEVNIVFREPFIFTGYRLPGQPWSYYLRSAFWLHNESLNFWTHALACLFVLTTTLLLGRHLEWFRDPRSWPIIGFCLGCVVSNALSAVAHLLHSKSTRHHYVFFILDYAGVTFYNLSNGIGAMYTCSHHGHYQLLQPFYLPVVVVLGWLSFLLCLLARLKYKGHHDTSRKLLMVGVMTVMAAFCAWPMLGRYTDCWAEEGCSLHSLNHISIVFVMFALDGLLFAAHCPERWFPGRFDLWGHGHQWFHVGIMLTEQLQLYAVHVDIVQLERGHHSKSELATLLLPFLALAVLQGLTLWHYWPAIHSTASRFELSGNKRDVSDKDDVHSTKNDVKSSKNDVRSKRDVNSNKNDVRNKRDLTSNKNKRL